MQGEASKKLEEARKERDFLKDLNGSLLRNQADLQKQLAGAQAQLESVTEVKRAAISDLEEQVRRCSTRFHRLGLGSARGQLLCHLTPAAASHACRCRCGTSWCTSRLGALWPAMTTCRMHKCCLCQRLSRRLCRRGEAVGGNTCDMLWAAQRCCALDATE